MANSDETNQNPGHLSLRPDPYNHYFILIASVMLKKTLAQGKILQHMKVSDYTLISGILGFFLGLVNFPEIQLRYLGEN